MTTLIKVMPRKHKPLFGRGAKLKSLGRSLDEVRVVDYKDDWYLYIFIDTRNPFICTEHWEEFEKEWERIPNSINFIMGLGDL